MARVLFTPLAHNDLQTIWDYLDEEAGQETADGILDIIEGKCEKLAAFPEAGQIRNELLANLRSFVVKSYVVFICRFQMALMFCACFTVPETSKVYLKI